MVHCLLATPYNKQQRVMWSFCQALEQSQLETVVPKKEGARVMIVGGQLRQRLATLLKKNNETGLAAVQLLDELSVEKLSLDDIAEYVGEDD